jgi:hypothetical protein
MPTRDQFVVLADAYRIELRRRGLLILPLMIIAIIGFVLMAGLTGRVLGNHSVVIGIWIIVFFGGIFALTFYQAKSRESLAKKCGLTCSNCYHVLALNDLKLVTATGNCPSCGVRFYS